MKVVNLVEAFRFLANGVVKVIYPAVVEVTGEEWARWQLSADAEIIEGSIDPTKHYMQAQVNLTGLEVSAVVKWYNGRRMSYWYEL